MNSLKAETNRLAALAYRLVFWDAVRQHMPCHRLSPNHIGSKLLFHHFSGTSLHFSCGGHRKIGPPSAAVSTISSRLLQTTLVA